MKFQTLSEAVDFARTLHGRHNIYRTGLLFEVIESSIEVKHRELLVTIDNENKEQVIKY